MGEKTYKNNILIRMQLVHLGKILFNLQFLMIAIMLASVMTFIFPAIYYLMLIAISLLTIFSIYAWYPEFSSFWAGGETLTKIATIFAHSWKYTVPITLVLAVASIVCLSFDDREKQIPRIILSVLFAVFAIIILVLKFINEGGLS